MGGVALSSPSHVISFAIMAWDGKHCAVLIFPGYLISLGDNIMLSARSPAKSYRDYFRVVKQNKYVFKCDPQSTGNEIFVIKSQQ